MRFDFDTASEKPLFLQLADQLEDNILRGIFKEETQIPSTTEISVKFRINPATANRGVNMLVDEGIIYKRRGVGMFVTAGAIEKIQTKRKRAFYSDYITPLLEESGNLGITRAEIIDMITRGEE